MIVRLLALLFAAMLLAAPAQAQGGRRIALVIGNAGYNAQVGRLDNPGRDADLIANALRGRGFTVTVIKDAGRVALQQAVDRYAKSLGQAGPGAVGFFYYSGHGVANPENGRNYVVPVDAPNAGDDSLWYNSVELQQLVRTITTNAGDATNIVVFDACREVLALPKGKNLGAGYKGLERMAGVPSTLIAFSTSPGALAADRDRTAPTGPYATELAKALGSSGADVRAMFDSVKFGVLQRTARKQVPWVEDGLLEQVFLGGAPGGTTPAPAFTAPKPAAVSGGITSDPARWGLTKQELMNLSWPAMIAKISFTTRLDEARIAADGGDAIAAFLLGGAYYTGSGVTQDYATAYRWLLKAAEAGQPDAQMNVGFLLERGQGVAKDLNAAIDWYRRAIDQGNSQAMVNLGVMYDRGTGVPQDNAAALALFRQAADHNHVWGMNNIGWYYESGRGVAVDYGLAMQWYKRAADLKLPPAMFNIGKLYHNGRGVPEDRAQALGWFRKAADAGDADGIANVGWYYLNGWGGLSRDYAQALIYSRRASDAGNDAAATNLGYLYENGYGIAKDRAEAEKWYRLGAARGNKIAVESLKRLGLTP